ncbi:hypothetical protein [Streptomyces aidingensis]|uniref:Uncharacterized protein n=1 Tax=Streptomyces aidingensis TaxID=910347 RepID=A0A1I1RQS8_9ACTN|nr:hypothetical protein [Streptomyces aidingensis]SFD33923.1 hypothetical protein SAMN05421773_113114 [Streptomyces aidingensis]
MLNTSGAGMAARRRTAPLSPTSLSPTPLSSTPAARSALPPAAGGAAGESPWDLVTVPAREGLEAVDILRLRSAVGPVLHDRDGDTVGFLVPPGTWKSWDLPGSACTQTCGPARAAEGPPVTGAGWVLPPGSTGTPATAPDQLRAALGEAARTLRAAERTGHGAALG